jgi:pimeloyl-ACP methyl ester carboxylesterase
VRVLDPFTKTRSFNATQINPRMSQHQTSSALFEQLERRQLLSGDVLGSADASGHLTLSYTNTSGAVSVLEESSQGVTKIVGIDSLAQSPPLQGALDTWSDSRDGRVYGAAASDDGLLVFVKESQGSWSWRNLSTELGQPRIGTLTLFSGTDGSVSIAGLTDTGDVAIYSTPAVGDWQYQNVSDDLRTEDVLTPEFEGKLVSWVTAWGGKHIAGLDAEGNIQAVWWAPGMSKWESANLSAMTGAPMLSGSLTAYVTSWGGINLAGIDSAGNLSATWWVPNNPWRTNNLTDQFDGPTLAADSLSSYVTPWGGLNIVGRDAAGQMTVYWWAPSKTTWSIAANLVANAPQPDGPTTGIVSSTGTINLVAQSSLGHVLRYFWNPGDGGTWHFQDMNDLALPPAQAVDFSAVDFLDITGIGRSVGEAWLFGFEASETAFGETESTTGDATMRVSAIGGGSHVMTMDSQDDANLLLPRTTFQRRADGVYLTGISGLQVVGGSGGGAEWNFDALQLTPSLLTGSFSDTAPFTISMPSGIAGELGGTVTTTTSLDGARHPVQVGAADLTASKITLTLQFDATGWLDMLDGNGRLSGSFSETLTMTFFAAPGVGSVQLDQVVNVSTTGFGQIDVSIDFTTDLALKEVGNKLRGTIQRGALDDKFLPYIDVSLRRVSQGIDEIPALTDDVVTGTRTWVLLHGRTDEAESFFSMAEALDRHDSDDQVLVLDWSGGAADNHLSGLFLDGAAWIPPVAEWVSSVMVSLNIGSGDLILVGHSWGTFVAYDIANYIEGVSERIVALDPAGAALGRYHTDDVDFGSVSAFSWAFDGSGPFGSTNRSATARESFHLTYQEGSQEPSAFQAHAAPKFLFEQLVRRNQRAPDSFLAGHFNLDRILNATPGPWKENRFAGEAEAEFLIAEGDDPGTDWGSSWNEVLWVKYFDSDGKLVSCTDTECG